MRIFILLLGPVSLQALPSSDGAKIYVKRSLEAGSLSNIYIDYGAQAAIGKFTLSYGFCGDMSSAHPVDEFDLTEDYKPEKFSWLIPSDAQDGCFFAKDASGNILASSGQNTVKKRFSKRGHPELADMYFNAVDYHQNKRISKRSTASSKSKSKCKSHETTTFCLTNTSRNWYYWCWYGRFIQWLSP